MLAQLGQLAHALQQLQALFQGLGGTFVAALLVQIGRGGQGRQAGQQGEVGFPAAPQGWGLGWLEGAIGQFQALEGLARFQEQQ